MKCSNGDAKVYEEGRFCFLTNKSAGVSVSFHPTIIVLKTYLLSVKIS
jgi:hypothetical protein